MSQNKTLENYAVEKLEYLEMRELTLKEQVETLKEEVAILKQQKENIKNIIAERFEIQTEKNYMIVRMNSFYSDDNSLLFSYIRPLIDELIIEGRMKNIITDHEN